MSADNSSPDKAKRDKHAKPDRAFPEEETCEDTSLNRPHGHKSTTDLDPTPDQYGESASDRPVEEEHNTPHADNYEELAETRNDKKNKPS